MVLTSSCLRCGFLATQFFQFSVPLDLLHAPFLERGVYGIATYMR